MLKGAQDIRKILKIEYANNVFLKIYALVFLAFFLIWLISGEPNLSHSEAQEMVVSTYIIMFPLIALMILYTRQGLKRIPNEKYIIGFPKTYAVLLLIIASFSIIPLLIIVESLYLYKDKNVAGSMLPGLMLTYLIYSGLSKDIIKSAKNTVNTNIESGDLSIRRQDK